MSTEDCEVLILDEADRLLDLGFCDEVEELVKLYPRSASHSIMPFHAKNATPAWNRPILSTKILG